MIEILQKRGTGLQSKAIEELTESQWSHTAMRFLAPYVGQSFDGKPVLIEYGDVIEAWSPFVRKISKLSDGHEKGTVFDVFSLRVPLSESEFKEFAKFATRQVGKRYATRDCIARVPVLGQSLGHPDEGLSYWQYEDWFCSELTAATFEVVGLRLFNFMPPWKVTPALVPESLILNPISRTEVV